MDKCFDGGNCGEGGFCNDCPLLKFIENQVELPEEFAKVLYENLEDLYATSENVEQEGVKKCLNLKKTLVNQCHLVTVLMF
jgi:hypothetical protein